jgi:hypothetical protein
MSIGNVTISNVRGQVLLGRFNEVVASLNTVGQTDLAEILQSVEQAILASKGLSDAEKREHIELISELGTEAAAPQPSMTKLKALGSGLITALKAVPDLVDVANKLSDGLARFQGGTAV